MASCSCSWPAIRTPAWNGRRFPLVDITADRFDAGVRLGEQLAPGMVAVRIGPDLDGGGGFIRDSERHRTVDTGGRFVTSASTGASRRAATLCMEFERRGRELHVQVDGQLTVTDSTHAQQAALDGVGIAYLMRDRVEALLASGELVQVLEAMSAVLRLPPVLLQVGAGLRRRSRWS